MKNWKSVFFHKPFREKATFKNRIHMILRSETLIFGYKEKTCDYRFECPVIFYLSMTISFLAFLVVS